ncbi:MAG: diacylglycerol kinase family protein [Bdellovibrionales bacterium]|nr:diacylglycerol kinase family protein [Bdellovibrionales bacterium]
METRPSFTIVGRLNSITHAVNGITLLLKSQHNAWVHAAATFFVVGMGLALDISASEWCWVVITVVAVFTAEALNTAFELLCDVASPEFHPLVKNAKDVAAGAVLISALGAVIIGCIIFIPHIAG